MRWGNTYDVREHGLELSLHLFEETARGGWSPAHLAELDEPTAEIAVETTQAGRASGR